MGLRPPQVSLGPPSSMAGCPAHPQLPVPKMSPVKPQWDEENGAGLDPLRRRTDRTMLVDAEDGCVVWDDGHRRRNLPCFILGKGSRPYLECSWEALVAPA